MSANPSKRFFAFSVHVLTAAGAVVALFALLAATHGDWPLMFLWLGVALVIDAIDGPLARAVNIAEVLPNWSGETLDLVADYTTYVFVPAYAIAASGLSLVQCVETSTREEGGLPVPGLLVLAQRN